MAITDADWLQWSAGTEISDTTSWERIAGNPCEAGMGHAVIPAGTTYTIDASGNRGSADPAWVEQAFMCHTGFSCERTTSACTGDVSTEYQIDYTAVCDGTLQKSIAGSVDVTVADGETVTIIPIFNGVEDPTQAVVITASGTYPINASGPDIAVTEGDAGTCTFNVRAETSTGTTENSVSITSLTGSLGYV
jgi:hypothetical protein